MVRANSKRKSNDMKKIKLLLLFFFSVFYLNQTVISAEIDIYKKIDLFGEVLEKLKNNGVKDSKIEGKESVEWKLVDGIDLIVHIFHPEKRKFYELEKIWSELIPKEKVMI